MNEVQVRKALAEDATAISSIYNQHIDIGGSTFDRTYWTVNGVCQLIVKPAPDAWFIAEHAAIVGWSANHTARVLDTVTPAKLPFILPPNPPVAGSAVCCNHGSNNTASSLDCITRLRKSSVITNAASHSTSGMGMKSLAFREKSAT